LKYVEPLWSIENNEFAMYNFATGARFHALKLLFFLYSAELQKHFAKGVHFTFFFGLQCLNVISNLLT